MILPYVFAFLFVVGLTTIPFILAYYSKQERTRMWDGYGQREAFIATAHKATARIPFRLLILWSGYDVQK
jgi:hypothetical protein